MEKVLPLKNIEAICSNKQNAELYVILLVKLLRPHLYQIKKVRLGRETSLAERIWMNKLIEHNNQARGIVERIMCPYKVEDM